MFVGDAAACCTPCAPADGSKLWTFKTQSGDQVVAGRRRRGRADRLVRRLPLRARRGHRALKWKFETDGPVHATPAVHDGVVIIAGCDESLRAIQRQPTARSCSGSRPAPIRRRRRVIDGDRAYFGTFNNEVLAVRSASAKKIVWRYQNPERQFPFYSSAALVGGRVIVGSRDKLVHAIDAATGKPAWTFTTQARVDSSPAVAGGRVYIGSSDGRLYVLERRDRREGMGVRRGRGGHRLAGDRGGADCDWVDGRGALLFRVIYNSRFTI